MDDVERILGRRPFANAEMRNIDRFRHGAGSATDPPAVGADGVAPEPGAPAAAAAADDGEGGTGGPGGGEGGGGGPGEGGPGGGDGKGGPGAGGKKGRRLEPGVVVAT